MSLGDEGPRFEMDRDVSSLLRGEAYLAARQGSKAAVELQKILGAIAASSSTNPIDALAHLGLGRAYVCRAISPMAEVAYQDFLTLWKDADPDFPVLQQAK